MTYYEKRATRNGIVIPIQCLAMKLKNTKRPVKLHYHEYTELLYGTSGCVCVHIGTRQYLLRKGDLVIVHAAEPHDVMGSDEGGTYTVIKFVPQVLLAGEQTYHEYSYALLLMENTHTRQEFFSAAELGDTEMEFLFSHLLKEWEAQDFGYELSLRADVTKIFLYILRLWHSKNHVWMHPENNKYAHIMETALSYINQNFADLTEEDTAKACGVSRTYFSRIFCRVMQVGFATYVNGIRLQEAERMLLTTELSVTEIAQAVGFSTTSHFIDIFRKKYRITPLRYRAQSRGSVTLEPYEH